MIEFCIGICNMLVWLLLSVCCMWLEVFVGSWLNSSCSVLSKSLSGIGYSCECRLFKVMLMIGMCWLKWGWLKWVVSVGCLILVIWFVVGWWLSWWLCWFMLCLIKFSCCVVYWYWLLVIIGRDCCVKVKW